jgi:hypothetical protein
MELARNLHAKLQEMCDCYLETDYLPELQKMSQEQGTDLEEEGLKYLSLSLMHTISEKGRKLTLKRKKEELRVTMKSEEKELLPAPPAELFEKIIEIMRKILHLEEEAKGELPLVLGLRNGQVEVMVKIEHKPDQDTLKFKFPEW